MRTVIPTDAVLIPQGATKAFSGILFDVYQWQQKQFDGTVKTFEMLKRPDSVHAICIIKDKILITQEEQPHRGIFYGLPGGRHDHKHETELQAAQRETLEEVGLAFDAWRLIDAEQPESKIEWFSYIFVAFDGSKKTLTHQDSGEKITAHFMTLGEVKCLIQDQPTRHRLPAHIFNSINNVEQLLTAPEYTN